jgi:hypothetical protein
VIFFKTVTKTPIKLISIVTQCVCHAKYKKTAAFVAEKIMYLCGIVYREGNILEQANAFLLSSFAFGPPPPINLYRHAVPATQRGKTKREVRQKL